MEPRERQGTQIWTHGVIQTMEDALPLAQAMVVQDGRILYVGTNEGALAYHQAGVQHHNLEGRYVLPGLVEGHIHLAMYGESLLKLLIRDLSKEDILLAVQRAAQDTPPGEWIVGGTGWNNEVWANPAYPTARELDEVAPHHPVLLPRMDGHMVWVNSEAFRQCGITADTPNPDGGEWLRQEDGALLGCASNAAARMLQAAVPAPNKAEHAKAFLCAQQKLFEYGVTSVNDMSTSLMDIEVLQALYENGTYKLRFHGALMDFLQAEAHSLEAQYLKGCPRQGLYGDRFTVQACKILADGSVGAQSAALLQPYQDRPDYSGMLMQSDEELRRLFEKASKLGLQLVIHAIGDAAILQVLDCFEALPLAVRPQNHRWRIEHFQLVTGDALSRAKRLGFVASMQPLHAPNSASMAVRRLGQERAARAYAGGLVLREMGRVAWGSDAPVAPPSPLSGMHAAITRTNDQREPKGGFCMENAVSPIDALRGYTLWGAYAQGTEQKKGSLAAGKMADFVILDRPVLTVATERPEDLLAINVLATVIGGETVWMRTGQKASFQPPFSA